MSSWIDDAVIVDNQISPIPLTTNYSDILENLVTRRVENITYLKNTLTGDEHWMNISKIKFQIDNNSETIQKRIEQWLSLGLSISPLLVCDGRNFIHSFSQLMEEYEYHYSNFAVQGIKMLKAFTSSLVDAGPTLNKVGGTIVYQYLKIPNIPCALDYYQVTLSLCDIMTFAYRKFMEQENIEMDKIIKLDVK
eukprot:gene2800-4208_t